MTTTEQHGGKGCACIVMEYTCEGCGERVRLDEKKYLKLVEEHAELVKKLAFYESNDEGDGHAH